MLKLTPEQIALFSSPAILAFEDRTVALFREHWPDVCAERGEPFVRELFRRELPGALACGMTCEQDASHYLNLCMALLVDFEATPRTDWVAAILNDPAASPTAKLYDLYIQVSKRYEAPAEEKRT